MQNSKERVFRKNTSLTSCLFLCMFVVHKMKLKIVQRLAYWFWISFNYFVKAIYDVPICTSS